MKKILLTTIAFLISFYSFAQKKSQKYPAQPKLIVGITIDQMRYDYLYRYASKYGKGGFLRLRDQGFNHKNHQYHYALTVTAAGHAGIFTGSSPAINGIVGNEWYSQSLGRSVYCVEDSTVKTVGGINAKSGQMSPKNLLTTTISDQLRLSTNFRNKIIGIAIKDRGSILPAGHSATAAYWFDTKEGNFITSSYYMNDLPQWVKDFNAQKLPAQLMSQTWNTILPIDQYTESTSDDQAYEQKFAGEEKAVFPHQIVGKAGDAYGVLPATPFGNTLTKEMALAAIKNENLGKGEFTDLLAVSFSSPDYVGHSFGPNSIEEEDTFIRLDKDLEEILGFLDNWVGKENYLVFLSADHGVMDIPGFWKQNKLPAGVLDMTKIKAEVRKTLLDKFGEGDIIRAEENYQMYLNHKVLAEKNISIEQVFRAIRPTVLKFEGIADLINLQDLGNSNLNDYQLGMFKNLHHATRGGDLGLVVRPGWFSGRTAGTTHGTAYNYDTHVPFLLYGWKIQSGETSVFTQIPDISATLANLLNILEPNGCIGKPTPVTYAK